MRFKHTGSYPKRDHITQYEETDFAFLSRLAEHYGIFYFFEAAGGVEKVIFADDNIFTKPLEKHPSLSWLPWIAGQREAAPHTIQIFEQHCGRVSEKVWLQDYNYREPHVPLLVSSAVDTRGRGNWVGPELRLKRSSIQQVEPGISGYLRSSRSARNPAGH